MNLPQEARTSPREAMPLPEKPMKLHQDTISPNQSFDSKFLTILDYTSSSGSKFQLTEIINNRTITAYAYLDTTILLPTDERRQMIQKSICENIPGIESIRFLSKYKLLIEKGIVFDWEKIAMQVIEVLEKTLEQKEES